MKMKILVHLMLLLLGLSSQGWSVEILPGGFVAPGGEEKSGKIERPTLLRRNATYHLYAPVNTKVRLEVHAVRVGKYTDKVRVSVRDQQGKLLAQAAVERGTKKSLEFTSQAVSGLLTVECKAGQSAVGVTAEGGKLLIPVGKSSVKIFKYANPLYFYVEKETQEFDLELSGQGELETAEAIVKGPDGEQVIRVSTVDMPVQQVVVKVPQGKDGKVWSVEVVKASRGVFEDCTLKLRGVGPFVSERKEDLIVPAFQLEAPVLVRPEEQNNFAVRAKVSALAVDSVKNLQFLVTDQKGKTIFRQELNPAERARWKPKTKLNPGQYKLSMGGRFDKQRFVREQELHIVDRPGNLTESKTTLVEGKAFFARGLYHVRKEDYELVKRHGFNIVQASPGNVPACERTGLKAAVALYGGMTVNPDSYRENILQYRDNPAVACWMTMDEPALHGVPLERMAAGYATIRELADHPAYTCICRPGAYTDYGRCTDIIAIDVYPVGKSPLTRISDTLEIAKKNTPGHTVWFIGQVWSWPNTRLVTAREHRCMSYLALTHADVRGLLWYSFRDPGWYLPENNPAVWAMCKQVNRELIELEPVLLKNNIWEQVQKSGKGEVHLAAKKFKNALYLIATNPTETAAELSVDLRPEGAGAKAREVFEKRDIHLRGGRLQDHFDSLDTRVYSIPIR